MPAPLEIIFQIFPSVANIFRGRCTINGIGSS
jgi:hypothetical protein